MITRRRLLWVGSGIASGAVAYPVLIEPRWFEVTRTRVPIKHESTGIVRVLHLSDFHASWAVPLSSIDRAIQSGLSEKPDLICITGDFITHRYDFDRPSYLATLRKLTVDHPTFAVLGNHDGGRWAKERRGYSDHAVVEKILEEAGINLLHNRSQLVNVRGTEFIIVGVGDLWSDELNATIAFRDLHGKHPVILLSHNPDSKDVMRPFQWDLMLCGHTHGGQVIIPFEGPRYAPVNDKRFVSGLHAWDGRQIYVTRGVGNLGSVRFLCRPEITLLEMAV